MLFIPLLVARCQGAWPVPAEHITCGIFVLMNTCGFRRRSHIEISETILILCLGSQKKEGTVGVRWAYQDNLAWPNKRSSFHSGNQRNLPKALVIASTNLSWSKETVRIGRRKIESQDGTPKKVLILRQTSSHLFFEIFQELVFFFFENSIPV